MPVGQVEEAESRNGNVELHRIDAPAEQLPLHPALQQFRNHADQRRVQLSDVLQLLEVRRVVQVLGCEQAEEFRMRDKVLPSEPHQSAHALDRVLINQAQFELGSPNCSIAFLQD